MDNKEKSLDIYLMGIGGTGMGAFAGLLKRKGHKVSGSDNALYSPMKEKLAEWGIDVHTPYQAKNLPSSCDLVIVGNVIRRENEEAVEIEKRNFAKDSFPGALNRLFLQDAVPIVAAGTHGKTTCSALLAHSLSSAKRDPGFLIGGIPINFNESFGLSSTKLAPFVVEGDEYDTAFFDKRPKFIHYAPQFLLLTSLEFDHADIYKDLDAVIKAFVSVLLTMTPNNILVVNRDDPNIKTAIALSNCQAKIVSYGSDGDYQSHDHQLLRDGIHFAVSYRGRRCGDLYLPLFGEHNVKNALGCYAILHQFGLSHEEIARGYKSFLGVKRRLEEKDHPSRIIIDDFAHHPSAVYETIKAARQKYPHKKICAIFEPRSATTCMKIFESRYSEAFLGADLVYLAPVGRDLPAHDRLNTDEIARFLNLRGTKAEAFLDYDSLKSSLSGIDPDYALLFMSNGDFKGMLKDAPQIFL